MPIYGTIIVIKRNGSDGSAFPLKSSSCLIGRGPDSDILIQLPNISQEHARIDVEADGQILLTNLSKVNPTLLNNHVVKNRVYMQHNDIFMVADRSFRWEFPPNSQYFCHTVPSSSSKANDESDFTKWPQHETVATGNPLKDVSLSQDKIISSGSGDRRSFKVLLSKSPRFLAKKLKRPSTQKIHAPMRKSFGGHHSLVHSPKRRASLSPKSVGANNTKRSAHDVQRKRPTIELNIARHKRRPSLVHSPGSLSKKLVTSQKSPVVKLAKMSISSITVKTSSKSSCKQTPKKPSISPKKPTVHNQMKSSISPKISASSKKSLSRTVRTSLKNSPPRSVSPKKSLTPTSGASLKYSPKKSSTAIARSLKYSPKTSVSPKIAPKGTFRTSLKASSVSPKKSLKGLNRTSLKYSPKNSISPKMSPKISSVSPKKSPKSTPKTSLKKSPKGTPKTSLRTSVSPKKSPKSTPNTSSKLPVSPKKSTEGTPAASLRTSVSPKKAPKVALKAASRTSASSKKSPKGMPKASSRTSVSPKKSPKDTPKTLRTSVSPKKSTEGIPKTSLMTSSVSPKKSTESLPKTSLRISSVSPKKSVEGPPKTSVRTSVSPKESTEGPPKTSVRTSSVSPKKSTEGMPKTSLRTSSVSPKKSTEGTPKTSLRTSISPKKSTEGTPKTSLRTSVSPKKSTEGTPKTSLGTSVSPKKSPKVTPKASLKTSVSPKKSPKVTPIVSLRTSVSPLKSPKVTPKASLRTSVSPKKSPKVTSKASLRTSSVSPKKSTKVMSKASLRTSSVSPKKSPKVTSKASLRTSSVSPKKSPKVTSKASLRTSSVSPKKSPKVTPKASLRTSVSPKNSPKVTPKASLRTSSVSPKKSPEITDQTSLKHSHKRSVSPKKSPESTNSSSLKHSPVKSLISPKTSPNYKAKAPLKHSTKTLPITAKMSPPQEVSCRSGSSVVSKRESSPTFIEKSLTKSQSSPLLTSLNLALNRRKSSTYSEIIPKTELTDSASKTPIPTQQDISPLKHSVTCSTKSRRHSLKSPSALHSNGASPKTSGILSQEVSPGPRKKLLEASVTSLEQLQGESPKKTRLSSRQSSSEGSSLVLPELTGKSLKKSPVENTTSPSNAAVSNFPQSPTADPVVTRTSVQSSLKKYPIRSAKRSTTLMTTSPRMSSKKLSKTLLARSHSSALHQRRHSYVSEWRNKRVSFGPNLSPEQFDRALPPATPLRKGARPLSRRPSAPDYYGSPILTSLVHGSRKRSASHASSLVSPIDHAIPSTTLDTSDELSTASMKRKALPSVKNMPRKRRASNATMAVHNVQKGGKCNISLSHGKRKTPYRENRPKSLSSPPKKRRKIIGLGEENSIKIDPPSSPDSKKSAALRTIHASKFKHKGIAKKKSSLVKASESFEARMIPEKPRTGLQTFEETWTAGITPRTSLRSKKKKLSNSGALEMTGLEPSEFQKRHSSSSSFNSMKSNSPGHSSLSSHFESPTVPREVFVSPLFTELDSSPSLPLKRMLCSQQTPDSLMSLSLSLDIDVKKLPLSSSHHFTGTSYYSDVKVHHLNGAKSAAEKVVEPRMMEEESPKSNTTEVSDIRQLLKPVRSPKSDYNDVIGVKRLLKTPAKSPKSDYTNVAGVKRLMRTPAGSPKSDCTNIAGVKRLMRTPAGSPKSDCTNIAGVKRLMRTPAGSPKSDYTNVAGVKRLMKTPQRSPKSDYTNVAGVKRLMKTPPRSPKSDYTNVVGVKRLMKTPPRSPKSDYTNVAGVKRLMKTPPRSPKSDYTNVAGVKRLMKTPPRSPKSDYTNVAGVKRLMKTPPRSPKSDYTNVAGVKRLMKAPPRSPKSDYTNVAGVKRLMKTPPRSPKSDYTNVAGLKRLMKTPPRSPKSDYTNVSGVKRVLRTPQRSPLSDYTNVTGVKRLLRTPQRVSESNYSDVQSIKRMMPTASRSPKTDKKAASGLTHLNSKASFTESISPVCTSQSMAMPYSVEIEVLPGSSYDASERDEPHLKFASLEASAQHSPLRKNTVQGKSSTLVMIADTGSSRKTRSSKRKRPSIEQRNLCASEIPELLSNSPLLKKDKLSNSLTTVSPALMTYGDAQSSSKKTDSIKKTSGPVKIRSKRSEVSLLLDKGESSNHNVIIQSLTEVESARVMTRNKPSSYENAALADSLKPSSHGKHATRSKKNGTDNARKVTFSEDTPTLIISPEVVVLKEQVSKTTAKPAIALRSKRWQKGASTVEVNQVTSLTASDTSGQVVTQRKSARARQKNLPVISIPAIDEMHKVDLAMTELIIETPIKRRKKTAKRQIVLSPVVVPTASTKRGVSKTSIDTSPQVAPSPKRSTRSRVVLSTDTQEYSAAAHSNADVLTSPAKEVISKEKANSHQAPVSRGRSKTIKTQAPKGKPATPETELTEKNPKAKLSNRTKTSQANATSPAASKKTSARTVKKTDISLQSTVPEVSPVSVRRTRSKALMASPIATRVKKTGRKTVRH